MAFERGVAEADRQTDDHQAKAPHQAGAARLAEQAQTGEYGDRQDGHFHQVADADRIVQLCQPLPQRASSS